MNRMGKIGVGGLMVAFVMLIIGVPLAAASFDVIDLQKTNTWLEDTAADFNDGTFVNTTTSGDSIVLATDEIEGTYDSNVHSVLKTNWKEITVDADVPINTSADATVTVGGNTKTYTLSNGENTYDVGLEGEDVQVSSTLSSNNYNKEYTFTSPAYTYWTLDNAQLDGSTVVDLFDNLNGTNYATTGADGMVDEALSFPNNGDNVTINRGTKDLYNSSKSFTFTVWYKPPSSGAEDSGAILGNHEGQDGHWLKFGIETMGGSGVAPEWDAYDGTSTGGLLANTDIPYNEWGHIAYRYNASNGERCIYINGTQDACDTRDHSVTVSDLYLGTRIQSGSHNDVNGVIDEAATYHRALTSSEIQDNYEADTNEKEVTGVTSPAIKSYEVTGEKTTSNMNLLGLMVVIIIAGLLYMSGRHFDML